jgi:hypothetical protein
MKVIRAVLAIVIAAGAMMFDWRGAQAGGAPWCAVFSAGLGDTIWDCSYWSFEACVPYVIAGTRGFCNENPRYFAPARPVMKVRPHHKRHPDKG